MAAELDQLDRKLLRELYLNSRMPLSLLAKKLRMSKQRANYRIQKMLREGSIKAFTAVIDRSRVDYDFDMFCYDTSPFSERQDKLLMQKILALNPTILLRCDGKWKLMVAFLCTGVHELASKQRQLRFLLRGHIIDEYHFLHILSLRYRLPGSEDEVRKPLFTIGKKSDVVKLDEKDRKILGALSENARASYLELSQKIKLPPETIRYRMKQLEKDKVILAYSLSVNPNLHGMHHYRVYVKLSVPNSQIHESILSFISTFPQVTRVQTLVSQYDFSYDAVVPSREDLRKVLEGMSHRYFKYIVEQEPIRIYEEYRYCFFPPL